MAYIGQQPVNTFSQVPTKDSFTGDGSTTTFDLSNAVVSSGENALEVFVNNVRQEPGSGKAFTLGLDGSNELKRITFSAAPASGASIYVINDKTSFTQGLSATDLGGTEFILDADGDTSLTADTDDRIDIKIAGSDHFAFLGSSGDTVIKPLTDAKDIIFQQFDGNKVLEINDGGFVGVGGNSNAAGEIRIFEDTDNGSNYVGFSAPNVTTSRTYIFPAADGSSGTSLTTDGSGNLSWSAGVTIANDSNNRVVTATGSSGLNGEANLTFDGSILTVSGEVSMTTLDIGGTNVTSTAAELNILDGVTATAAEISILDGVTSASSVTIVDADQIILNDGGTMKQVTVSALNTYTSSSIAADNVSSGSSAVNITTSSGNITIDAAANDTDIIFKGTDNTADITMLTLDGSEAGAASFLGVITANAGVVVDNITIDGTEIDLSSGDLTLDVAGDIILDANGADIKFKDDGTDILSITNNSTDVDITVATQDKDINFKGDDGGSGITALSLDMSDAGTAVFNHDIRIADGGQIGSASDADAIAISSGGVVTFTQAPVFPDGSIAVADLDIDGATDIGADLVDADLFIVDDGAGGTNRKVAASRIKTYIGGGTQWQAVKTANYTASAGQGVFANTTSGSFTVTLPAGTLGDEVTIVDYAGTFDSNALTVAANGSEKIFASTDDLTVSTERAAFTLVFTDSTQGWLFKND